MKVNAAQKNIPDGWKLLQLENIGEFKNGVNKSKEDFGHGYPFVNLMDIFGFASITNKKFDLVNVNKSELKNYDLRKGDVLFIRSSVKPEGVGLTTLVTDNLIDTVYSGFIIRFREKNIYLSHGFKKYCFSNRFFRNELIAKSSISANTNINQESLKRLTIIFPPIPEQNRIVAVLETWDKAIEKLEKKIEIKKKIKDGLMKKLLTGKIRLAGFTNKWTVRNLDEVARIGDGNHSSGYPKNNEMVKSGTPFIRGSNIINGTISSRDIKYITEKKHLELKKGHLKSNDILLVNRGEIGKVCLVPAKYDNSNLNSQLAWIRADSINYKFLYYQLASEAIQRILSNNQSGGALQQITIKEIKALKIQVPLLEEQIAIVDILTTIDSVINDLYKKHILLKDQKKYLLNNLITGAIRTPENLKIN